MTPTKPKPKEPVVKYEAPFPLGVNDEGVADVVLLLLEDGV
jgi:hypothetical protein